MATDQAFYPKPFLNGFVKKDIVPVLLCRCQRAAVCGIFLHEHEHEH
ncbi:MAG: hypothetical protein ACD_39C00161G0004, partial [uncultured bacterium]